MENSKTNYFIIGIDPEEGEVVCIFTVTEEGVSLINLTQTEEEEEKKPTGPELYYPEEREKIRRLRRQEMEKKRRLRRLLRWMM